MTRSTPTTRRTAGLVLLVALLAAATVGCSKKDAPPPRGATTVTVDGTLVNAIVRPPSQSATGTEELVTVLFLHGQSYDSGIWDDIGLLDAVSQKAGFRAVAVDLPGYGDTPERKDTARVSNAQWLGDLIDELGGPTHVVVVSPSMSGSYSLPYLEDQPKAALLGFVPVAPVGIDDFHRRKDAVAIRTMSVWGSEDPTYSKGRAAHLISQMRALKGGAKTEIIQGAGHACYEDAPGKFTALLLGFLKSLGG